MIGVERLRKIRQYKPIQCAEYLGASRKAHRIPKIGQTDMTECFGPAMILQWEDSAGYAPPISVIAAHPKPNASFLVRQNTARIPIFSPQATRFLNKSFSCVASLIACSVAIASPNECARIRAHSSGLRRQTLYAHNPTPQAVKFFAYPACSVHCDLFAGK
jgi:hypothetical protein